MLNTEEFDTNEEWRRAMTLERKMQPCPDCGCCHGQKHHEGCDVERCSSCGQQRISCGCPNHDPERTRWMGVWPTGKEVSP
jgi:hypothetical protein